ncbi:GGDEF domain-containing response regulator [Vibrio genomosp. F10]|uniref:GGDEF domain-containing response regulator n=2 Tax=Vibrio genomosp. F10 TaxID=723171 RepID=UPI00030B39FF|nr:diguanylate cyclase [Vibrio genomosp. F10]OEF09036.1 diguanylate cyclase response regulator [Vibrio genomosp. F10 str. 9ZD137]
MTINGSSMRILLVDDVQMDRMQLAIRLKQLGHHVEAVSSGKEALSIYLKFDPELILLDITMPEMNGFELSQEIRRLYPDWIPIIFLSSHEEPSMIAKAIDAGGDDYLIKPVDKLVLNSKLIAMQRIAQMRRELKRASIKLQELNQALQHQVNEDGLTSLYNRRFIDEKLQDMISWHGRHKFPLTLILIDVDRFKLFNDNYGHIQGDKCLIAIATLTKELFSRSAEYVGRYGGEEFAILLSHTGQDKALNAAKRIKNALSELAYPHEYNDDFGVVTVSQGIYTTVPNGHESINDIYSKADEALYAAKHQGRNTYVLADPTGE